MKIIITNGAPRCGKDTLVRRLLEVTEDSVYIRLKDPLYKRFAEKHNLTFDEVVTLCGDEFKDKPCDLLGGKTPRQELIHISEDEIKVEMGPDGVAELTAYNILDYPEHGRKTFIFPDGGFANEIGCLKRILKHFGLTEFIIIRVVKDGVTFEALNDSREYIPNPSIIINNDVDESHLPEEERGQHMLQQYLDWLNK